MSRTVKASFSALAIAVLTTVVWAASAHFQRGTSDSLGDGGALVANFTISGLGNDISSITITLDANASATYECVNGGGKNPSASNKTTTSTHITVPQTFPVHNGSASGSLQLGPPASTLNCPGGQTLCFKSVTYTNVVISASGGDSKGLADQSYNNPACP